MTELNKPLSRRARSTTIRYRKKDRRIVVILEPGDVIGMRLEGTRQVYRAGIDSVYRQMAHWHADAERLRKKKTKQNKGEQ